MPHKEALDKIRDMIAAYEAASFSFLENPAARVLAQIKRTIVVETAERVYAWEGYLYDFESHLAIRGLTHAEEVFLVNNGTPFYVNASPVNGSTVRVSCITELKQVSR